MKIQQVSETISLLINEIVELRKEKSKGYCIDIEAKNSKACDKKCVECKQKFFKNMEEYLNNKYNI